MTKKLVFTFLTVLFTFSCLFSQDIMEEDEMNQFQGGLGVTWIDGQSYTTFSISPDFLLIRAMVVSSSAETRELFFLGISRVTAWHIRIIGLSIITIHCRGRAIKGASVQLNSTPMVLGRISESNRMARVKMMENQMMFLSPRTDAAAAPATALLLLDVLKSGVSV